MDTEQRVQAVTDLVAALFEATARFAQEHEVMSPNSTLDGVEVIFESIAVYLGLMVGGMRPPFREALFEEVCSRAREYFEDAEKIRQEFAEAR